MLNISPRLTRTCEGISRRHMLQVGSLAGLGLSLPTLLRARQASAAANTKKDVSCILIWTRGGTSHHDTFDPKPDAPVSVRGEFGVIPTATPGVNFTDIVPRMAREQKRFALLRGWNPQNGSHGTADQFVMSGRKFNPAIHYPCFGSVASYYQGFKTALPPFVQLGNNVDRRFGGGSAGILGLEHGPFEILADPNADKFSVRDITPPSGVTMERVDRRREILAKIDGLQRAAELQPQAYDALDEHYKTAHRMITSPETKQAFALGQEDAKLREAYGKHRFGQSCLLARRLIESGVRFVTVTDGGWDTHQNNFKSLKNSRLPPVDQGLPQLLIDLEERGMLETTLVCWLTDFGRTPTVNSASGRDHWSSSGFAIMAGAGVPGGHVLGETTPDGGAVAKDEYLSSDIATTIYTKLGIPHDLIARSPDDRPVRLIEGRPIKEWM
jgi:uncharacterized protein (DUF1501 family)